jgi:hypothetical protein
MNKVSIIQHLIMSRDFLIKLPQVGFSQRNYNLYNLINTLQNLFISCDFVLLLGYHIETPEEELWKKMLELNDAYYCGALLLPAVSCIEDQHRVKAEIN